MSRSDTGLRLGLHYHFFPDFNFISFVFTFVLPLLPCLCYSICISVVPREQRLRPSVVVILRLFCVGQSLGCNLLDMYLSVSSDMSLLGSIRSGWGCLWSRSDNGLRLGTPSHLITLPFPSLSASFVFRWGLSHIVWLVAKFCRPIYQQEIVL